MRRALNCSTETLLCSEASGVLLAKFDFSWTSLIFLTYACLCSFGSYIVKTEEDCRTDFIYILCIRPKWFCVAVWISNKAEVSRFTTNFSLTRYSESGTEPLRPNAENISKLSQQSPFWHSSTEIRTRD